jgi:hypothetical protein
MQDREDGTQAVRGWVMDHMADIARHTKADIFLVYRKPVDDQASVDGELEDNRPRFVIFGDCATEENARIRMLVAIDKLVSLNLIPLTINVNGLTVSPSMVELSIP